MSKVDAAKFVFACQNWYELVVPIATHRTPARAILRNGIRFESPFIYWPDIYGIFLQDVYTPPFLPIEPDDIVLDVGANIGVFSIYAATKTRNTIHAFEPFPANFAALKHNVQANGQNNVCLHQRAISDTTGVELFSAAKIGMNQLYKVAQRSIDYIKVSSIMLEDFMSEQHLDRIDFLKLDCEGSEGVILSSISPTCLARIHKIAMEFHDGISKLKHTQIQALLENVGFATSLVWDGTSKLGLLYAWRR